MKIELKQTFNKNHFIDFISKGDEDRKSLYEEEFETLFDEVKDILFPTGYFISDQLKDEKVVFCLVTLGEEVEKRISYYFNNNEYLKGYYLNSLADFILYAASDQLYTYVCQSVLPQKASERIGIDEKELLIWQKDMIDKIREKIDINLTANVTSNYMITPVKSLGYYYKIQEVGSSIDHSCDNCNNTICDNRKVDIEIIEEINRKRIIKATLSSNLLYELQKNAISINADCGGNKACGKCKIKIVRSLTELPISKTEEENLSLIELEKNIRLACCQDVAENLSIEIINESSMSVLEINYEEEGSLSRAYLDRYDIGIDIGTTTIGISLINNKNHITIAHYKYINPQRIFGADIISRIKYYNNDPANLLTKMIRESTYLKIIEILKELDIKKTQIDKITIAGNTAMTYFLLGKDATTLGKSPYEVEIPKLIEIKSSELFDNSIGIAKISILPWISAFIGGDILSVLYYLDILKQKENILVIDIGTNGEIVLKNKDKLYATSSAAGPAFEGANIKCGIGSIDGAIHKVEKTDDMLSYSTVNKKEPIGICGTGLIDLVALLIKDEIIDKSGKFKDGNKHFIYQNSDEEIALYQEDIRELQLAKAAIYTGIELLFQIANIEYKDIDYVYIAGGFGEYLNVENAIEIGLLPEEFLSKSIVIGNGSLKGTIKYMQEKDIDTIYKIQKEVEAINLNMLFDFNKVYIKNINF